LSVCSWAGPGRLSALGQGAFEEAYQQLSAISSPGMSNRQIGERLFLSHRTVGTHLYRVFPKLGITTRGTGR
jgi:DNA-binding NarL/FixJ family response regulator